jgi:hypothetical protein
MYLTSADAWRKLCTRQTWHNVGRTHNTEQDTRRDWGMSQHMKVAQIRAAKEQRERAWKGKNCRDIWEIGTNIAKTEQRLQEEL